MSYEKLSELRLSIEVIHFGPSDETFTGKWYVDLIRLFEDRDIHSALSAAERRTGCSADAAKGYLNSCLTMGVSLACEPEIQEYFMQLRSVASEMMRSSPTNVQP
jgi:hypothetical protein